MNDESLSAKRSYIAMLYFLENYYAQTGSDEIGALLGSLSLNADEMPMDAAMWQEWLGCVEKSRKLSI